VPRGLIQLLSWLGVSDALAALDDVLCPASVRSRLDNMKGIGGRRGRPRELSPTPNKSPIHNIFIALLMNVSTTSHTHKTSLSPLKTNRFILPSVVRWSAERGARGRRGCEPDHRSGGHRQHRPRRHSHLQRFWDASDCARPLRQAGARRAGERSLGDANSSLGDAYTSLGDANEAWLSPIRTCSWGSSMCPWRSCWRLRTSSRCTARWYPP
jgi:hypothetical protein